MSKIVSLRDFNTNYLEALRAASLLTQEVVKAEFAHYNSTSILDPKKVGFLATEVVKFNNHKYFTVISFLCENLNFGLLEGKTVFDYNQEESVFLKKFKGTENIPVLRVAQSQDNSSALILHDRIKVDFFEYEASALKSTTLFFQLLSRNNLLKELSGGKVLALADLVKESKIKGENNFNPHWRGEFISRQGAHLLEMSQLFPSLSLPAFYESLLSQEGLKTPFKK